MSQASPIATDRSRTSPPGLPGILNSPGRILLGLILVFGACSKLHFNGAWHFGDYNFFFAMAIGSYRTLPFVAVEWLALALPWVGLTLGALLIAGVGTRWVSLATSALLLIMAFLPRIGILGFASRSNPGTELLVDIGFALVAINLTLRSSQSRPSSKTQT
jgi:uncharacterized membrane protein YphA (DoxX/SURF4 family)